MNVQGIANGIVTVLPRFRHRYLYRKSRTFVLNRFARQSIGAEIGVWEGDFSTQILAAWIPGGYISLTRGSTKALPSFLALFMVDRRDRVSRTWTTSTAP